MTPEQVAEYQSRRAGQLPASRGNGRAATTTTIRQAPLQLEHAEQAALMEWCETQYIRHALKDGRHIDICLRDITEASLNGSYLQGDKLDRAKQWGRLQRAGAMKNAPDITVYYAIPPYHGLRIEMKKQRRDFRSKAEIRAAMRAGQADHLNLMKRLGYQACFAFGWVEAAISICEYFGWNARTKGLC